MKRTAKLLFCMALCAALLALPLASAFAEGEPLHTVTYSVQSPVDKLWYLYTAEQVRSGYLAKGPDAPPMHMSGEENLVFTAWYADEGRRGEPFNLLQTPILKDVTLYAAFGSQGDIVQLEGLKPAITLSHSLTRDEGNGTVTLTANVDNIPQGLRYDLQWQNDLSGQLADVPGETGQSITIPATEENLACGWRVAVTF